jgi:general secretion pathway protein E/type IV pilus assembly protein PilB
MIQSGQIEIPTEIQQLITVDQAWYYHVIPKSGSRELLTLFISEENNPDETKDELELLFGKTILLEKVTTDTISKALGKYYRKGSVKGKTSVASYIENNSDDFLENLIVEANETGCSDIHIEIYEQKCRVRMRIDGKLIERYVLIRDEYPAYVNKIKIKANLDIAEKRLPQDGRISFTKSAEKFDIRVSVLPTLYGEKIVLRLLSRDATDIDISTLGFQEKQLEDYLKGIQKPHGIVLISGPTGSGKTTTLYATLKILNQVHSNILTIEDPIEYTLEGINQVQLKESIGLTYTSALRTFLRQDPDIIMLGEIRDPETAKMAIRAALTGHLVLSTVHTNSAWGTVSRLIDMGVPPFLLASTLNLAVAQRLLRLLCPACKEESELTGWDEKFKITDCPDIKNHFVATGCSECFYTGYKGRTAVYEVITVDQQLAQNIKASNLDVLDILNAKKVISLQEAAMKLFHQGKTSLEEIQPIISSGN